MRASAFNIGDSVFVVDDGLSPVVQRGEIVRNLDKFPANVEVEVPSRDRPLSCHPDQVIRADADGAEVDEFLNVKDRTSDERWSEKQEEIVGDVNESLGYPRDSGRPS